MNKYTATFSNGDVIRRSTNRTYAVAWRASWNRPSGDRINMTGFSADASKVKPDKPNKHWISPRAHSANERARLRAENEAHLVAIGFTVEVVPAVLVNG